MSGEQGIAIVLLAAGMLASLVLLLRRRWPWPLPRARNGLTRRDVRDLVAKLDRATDRIDRRLEAHVTRLQDLLDQADAKAAGLRRLTDSAPEHGVAEAPAPAPVEAPAEAPAAQEPPAEANDAADPANDAVSVAGGAEIAQLAADGLDSIEIACRLGRPVGEVVLVLGLQRAARAHAE